MEKKLFTIAMILLISLGMLTILQVGIVKADTNVNLPDAELLNQFNEGWGPATVTVTDEPGLGVRFAYTLLTSSGTAKCDGYELSALAGGTGLHNADFTGYTHYRMLFKNVGTTSLTVNLFMNTGFTSGYPDPLDTYWECAWTDIPAGKSKIVTLDFLDATVSNAGDDPVNTQYPDGTPGVAIWRLTEVTKIGFQVLQSSGDGTGTLVVSGIDATTWLKIDASTVKRGYGDIDSFFDVFVEIDTVTDFFGFDIKVTWDAALLTLDNGTYETYLQTIWNDPDHTTDYAVTAPPTDFATPGMCRLVATSFYTSFTGSAQLLKLHFKVKDPLTNSVKQTPISFDLSIDKLSDKSSNSIEHACADGRYIMWGKKPTLSTKDTAGTSTSRTCKVYHEEFNVKLIVSDAADVTDFTFELRYNKDHLTYVSVEWNAWSSGSITDDPVNGKITGSTGPGTAQSGTATLLTIKFQSKVQRMWKNIGSSWINDVNSAIYIQTVDLTYPGPQPKLNYTRNNPQDPAQINVGSDFGYTFSPIKGDLDNNGKVEIDDLSAVALKYDTYNSQYNLVGTDDFIDIFDLVVVASNFWYEYSIPPP
jgi:hypothetical protein